MSDPPDESSHGESMEGIITALLIQMKVRQTESPAGYEVPWLSL